MKKPVLGVVGLLVAIASLYGAVVLLLFLAQDMLVFPRPQVAQERLTALAAEIGAKELVLEGGAGRLYGWHYPARGQRAVLYFHGNGESVPSSYELARVATEQGFDFYVFAYRGYPGSDGAPSEEGIAEDALVIWRHLEATYGASAIVLHGRSLGGGAVGTLLDDVRPAGIIFESTFTRLVDVAADQYPIFPVRALIRHRFPTIERAEQTGDTPVLVVHGGKDQTIPVRHGRSLAEAFANAEFVEGAGFGHNDDMLLNDAALTERWRAFIARVAP